MKTMANTGRGSFITVEGGEGAGKSTQVCNIHHWLTDHGHDVVLTRQPGGTPLAEEMREILLDNANHDMSPIAELLLVFAARAQFVHELVRPMLAKGKTVLCDRFTDSTYAYQGGGREMDMARLAMLEEFVHGDLQPDLTILLDLPVQVGMARAAKRSAADRFETEDQAFFKRVRSTYLERAEQFPGRFERIDAARDPADVWAQVRAILERRLDR